MLHHNRCVHLGMLLFVSFLSLFAAISSEAYAAPLSYPNNASVYLSSPQITLIIQAGSEADSLVVNATSVSVTLSTSTDGTFTLTSPQALSSSTVGSGGSLSQVCSSGTETDTITQTSGSEAYTLTPTGSACSQPTSGGGAGGGSVSTGGGGSAYDLAVNGGAATTAATSVTLSLYGTAAYTMEISNTSTFVGASWLPYATTMPWTLAPDSGTQTVYARFKAVGGTIIGSTQASIDLVPAGISASAPAPASPSSASLFAELAALRTRLAALLTQANRPTASSSTTHIVFIRDLSLGMTGNDVRSLQQFLIQENAGPAARALKAHGTTRTFGALTQAALIEFQKKVGITPTSGYFGPKTRAYVNSVNQ